MKKCNINLQLKPKIIYNKELFKFLNTYNRYMINRLKINYIYIHTNVDN